MPVTKINVKQILHTLPARLYADTNFLIYCFFKGKTPNEKALHNTAKRFLSTCFFLNAKIYVSNLAIDETCWKIICKKHQRAGLPSNKQSINSNLKNYVNAVKAFQKFIDNHVKTGNLELIGTPDYTISDAFNIMTTIPFCPRDAFHIAIANDQGITNYITNDNDFDNPKLGNITLYQLS